MTRHASAGRAGDAMVVNDAMATGTTEIVNETAGVRAAPLPRELAAAITQRRVTEEGRGRGG